jgi:GABA(A) receptor-associated protein
MNFRSRFSFEDRKAESLRVLQKYPDRIPVICEKNGKANNDTPTIDKNKYLVPMDLTVGQFLYVIRKRIKIQSSLSLFIFIDGYIPASSALMHSLYETSRNEDGYLYVTYAFENTFG